MEEEQIAEQTTRRPRFTFSMLNMPIGTELKFIYDDSCIGITKDMNNKIEFEGEEYTLSALATKLLVERRGWRGDSSVQGPKFFTHQGQTLADLRNIKERGETEE